MDKRRLKEITANVFDLLDASSTGSVHYLTKMVHSIFTRLTFIGPNVKRRDVYVRGQRRSNYHEFLWSYLC